MRFTRTMYSEETAINVVLQDNRELYERNEKEKHSKREKSDLQRFRFNFSNSWRALKLFYIVKCDLLYYAAAAASIFRVCASATPGPNLTPGAPSRHVSSPRSRIVTVPRSHCALCFYSIIIITIIVIIIIFLGCFFSSTHSPIHLAGNRNR